MRPRTPADPTAASRQYSADLRYHIRRLLRIREAAAQAAGIDPQQYLLLLQVKGMLRRRPTTIGALAERLQLSHQSTVELIDRLVDRGMLARRPGGQTRGDILVELRPPGEAILSRLERDSLPDLETEGTALVAALRRLDASSPAIARRDILKRAPAFDTVGDPRANSAHERDAHGGPGR